MKLQCTSRSSQRGGVLIATLIMVFAVSAICVCLLELDSSRLKRQIAGIDNKCAFNLAEAGIGEAWYGLSVGKSGTVGSITEPARFGEGLFWVEATDLGNHMVGLESTGMSGAGRVTLSQVVKCSPASIPSLGVFGSQRISIGTSALLSTYNSADGKAEPAPLKLQSNGDISVNTQSVIKGDATPGPLGSVALAAGASVTGSTAPSAAEVSLPAIDAPSFTLEAALAHANPKPLSISGNHAYPSINVAAGATLTLTGPAVVVVEQLTVEGTGELAIDATLGEVKLYVSDWLNLKSTSRVTFADVDPTHFSLLVSASGSSDRDGDGAADPAVRFLCDSPFYGTFYAPNARLALPSSFRFFGTLAADTLAIGNLAQVNYDVALLEQDAGVQATVGAVSWRVIEVPVSIARDLTTDPFEALGVVEALLAKPTDAHLDTGFQVYVKYLDLSGAEQYYRGPEASFDWGQVKQVLAVVRQPL